MSCISCKKRMRKSKCLLIGFGKPQNDKLNGEDACEEAQLE